MSIGYDMLSDCVNDEVIDLWVSTKRSMLPALGLYFSVGWKEFEGTSSRNATSVDLRLLPRTGNIRCEKNDTLLVS